MGSTYRTMIDVFQSREWKESSSSYLEAHELCELCLLEKNFVLATDTYLKLPPWRLEVGQPIASSNMIAVCKSHRRQLTRRKNRRYTFDRDGNVIEVRREVSA